MRMNLNKSNAIRLLENAGISFHAHEYGSEDGRIDAVSIAGKLGKSPDEIFKTLVAQTSSGHETFVFLVPASGELDLRKAARACGRKSIEMLPQKQLFPLTGYVHGGCSPVGMKKTFPAFLDETAQLFDTICVSGGRIGITLELSPETLSLFLGAPFVPLLKD